jgi:hypothetical protein
VAKLTAADGFAYDYFGQSVSISGSTAIVGVWLADGNWQQSGSAYIFERSGGKWTHAAKLTAGDAGTDDYFGFKVSIHDNRAIVGAWKADNAGLIDSGAAYIFERSGSNWNQVAKLTPSDGAADDYFGSAVSIYGNYAVVAANYDDDNGANSGSAYIFKRNGSSWDQLDKLTPSEGAGSDIFGQSVAICANYLVVGAPGVEAHSGAAYFFKLPGAGGILSIPGIPVLLLFK